jgi:hypothetical protein
LEIDVTLRNVGTEAAVIHTITITIVEDRGVYKPIIRPSAKYEMPIDDLRQGKSKSISVSHLVKAHGADRFKIALHTTRALLLRLTLEYNKDQKVEATVAT